MRHVSWTAAATIALLALTAPDVASAGEDILRCKGTSQSGSAEPRAFWRYYWIGSGSWSHYDKASPDWSGNYCAFTRAVCQTSAQSHHLNAQSKADDLAMDVTIDRLSGAVVDVSTRASVTTTFRGQCKSSDNPLPPPARRY